jgi:superfamily II RNA helicase
MLCILTIALALLAVLRQLGYLNKDDVVQLKGRVACEVNTCEELLLTELIFDNVLEPLEPAEIAGLLSSLVCQEKSQDTPSVNVTPGLKEACTRIMDIARGLGAIQVGVSAPLMYTTRDLPPFVLVALHPVRGTIVCRPTPSPMRHRM